MKEERKEVKKVEYKTVYVADDGTEFTSSDECKKYEESAKYAVKQLIKDIPRQDTNGVGQDFLSSFGYDDNIIAFKVRNADDVEAINRWIKCTFDIDGTFKGVSLDDIGTIQLFETYDYDNGLWRIGSVEYIKELFCKEVDNWVTKLVDKPEEGDKS